LTAGLDRGCGGRVSSSIAFATGVAEKEYGRDKSKLTDKGSFHVVISIEDRVSYSLQQFRFVKNGPRC
jgi:hypothetical protein